MTRPNAGAAPAAPGAATDPERDAADAVEAAGGVRLRIRNLCSACRQVFGMPDYDRYVAHARQRHPGGPLLARGDFFKQAIDRKYGKGGARCC